MFITDERLKKYRASIQALAHFLHKKIKYYDNNDKDYTIIIAMMFFIDELDKLDFSIFNSSGTPNYKNYLKSLIIHRSYTYKQYNYSEIIQTYVETIACLEKVDIEYIEHLFEEDSLLEYGYEDISYEDYANHLRENRKISNAEIEAMLLKVTYVRL